MGDGILFGMFWGENPPGEARAEIWCALQGAEREAGHRMGPQPYLSLPTGLLAEIELLEDRPVAIRGRVLEIIEE
jgi:hypothetical protein